VHIHEHSFGDVVVLSLSGDLVLGASTSVLTDRVRTILHLNQRHIVVDLQHVRYVDSGGLGALVEAFVVAKNRGGSLRLTHVSHRLRDLLMMTGLSAVFDCFDEGDEAAGRGDDHLPVH